MIAISVVVEGDVDAAVARRLAAFAGLDVAAVHIKNGRQNVAAKIGGYNAAARQAPFLVLVDLDECECAPTLIDGWLPNRSPMLLLRVAVREVESWLLADAERLSKFLRVRRSLIPSDPERLSDPKEALVNIARSSRRRDVTEAFVPRAGSGRAVGPTYVSEMIEFVSDRTWWRPEVAAEVAPSLEKAIRSLRELSAAAGH